MNFYASINLVIVPVRLTLPKVGLYGFNGPRLENDIREGNNSKGYKGGNRDYCSHFSVTFKTAGKILIIFVRLILGEVEVDRFTGP